MCQNIFLNKKVSWSMSPSSLDPAAPSTGRRTYGDLLYIFNNRQAAAIFLEFSRETCDFRLGGSLFHQSNRSTN